jgi:hypothetical protein
LEDCGVMLDGNVFILIITFYFFSETNTWTVFPVFYFFYFCSLIEEWADSVLGIKTQLLHLHTN